MTTSLELIGGPRDGDYEPHFDLRWLVLPACPARKRSHGVNVIYLFRNDAWRFAGYVGECEFASDAAQRLLRGRAAV